MRALAQPTPLRIHGVYIHAIYYRGTRGGKRDGWRQGEVARSLLYPTAHSDIVLRPRSAARFLACLNPPLSRASRGNDSRSFGERGGRSERGERRTGKMCERVCSRDRERESEGGKGTAPSRLSKYHSPAVLVPFDSHNLSRTGEQRRVCTRQGACGTKRRRIATTRLLEVRAGV